jgi:acyl-CoA thioesterase-1
MHWLVFHIVSGQAFFSGIALLIIAVISSLPAKPFSGRLTVVLFLVGGIAVSVSSVAIPYWLYAAAICVTLLWSGLRRKATWRRRAAYATIALWLTAALFEVPHHITPALQPADHRSIAIIGDSVTAGIGGDETSETWPSILAREHQLNVEDISHIGETAASALKRTNRHSLTAPVVVVEIGGNDLLGSTPSAQFETDLDRLLAALVADNRQIVMFELPLPPFFHEYGRIQRAAAARHNVLLIPRRIFLSVLADPDSTLDSIHLSQSGHQLMADCVWKVVKSAYAAD